jgi:TadE-like protein
VKRQIIAWCKRVTADSGGSEIAEAAVVMPIVFTLLLAIIFFGRAYNIYTTLTFAAHEGARVANTSTCATCGNAAGVAADAKAAVSQVLQASKINPAAIQAYSGTLARAACAGGGPISCSSSGNVQVCTNVQIGTTVAGVPACGSTVSFQYPYQLTIPFVSINHEIITLKADARLVADN